MMARGKPRASKRESAVEIGILGWNRGIGLSFFHL
jgi:hypothetical protein